MKIDRYNSRLDVVWLGRCATPMCYTLHHERGQDARFSTVLENWRTRQDSNLWPLPSEGSALSS